MKPNIVFGLVYIGCALLLICTSIPLVLRKIKMNHFYGIRIGKSFQSENNWYDINAYGGKELIVWSLPIILAGLISFVITLPFFLIIVIIPLCVLIAVIRILVYANRL